MKIVFLSKEYPPFGLNFASALFFPRIARAFASQGHQVHVICQAVVKEGDYQDEGVIVHRIGPKPRSGSAIVRMQYNFSAWLKLAELIRNGEVDIVDAPVTFAEGFLATVFKKKPVVLHTFAFSEMFVRTNSFSGMGELLFLESSSLLEKISLRCADQIIANSPETCNFLVKLNCLPRDRIREIWEVRIDYDKWTFTQSDIRSKLGIPLEAPMILYVGWLQARKGVQVLCRSIKKVLETNPKAIFVFAGRDTQTAPGGKSFKQYIMSAATNSGFLKNVKIIEDFLTEEDLVRLYSSCDAFVLPSLSETFGWPVIEALCCGRNVVATRTGIVPTLSGLGIVGLEVVPPGDAPGLALAIIRALGNRVTFDSVTMNRKIMMERMDFGQMVEKIISVHQEVLNSWKK